MNRKSYRTVLRPPAWADRQTRSAPYASTTPCTGHRPVPCRQSKSCVNVVMRCGERQEALLRTTKTGKPRVVPLPGIVFEAMAKLKGRQGLLFGFKDRHSFNQALARACKRAGIRKLTSHKIGRHAFAARLLAQGYTLKEVQEGGGWGSYRMVANVYGHLERSSVHNAMRAADTNLARLIDGSSNVVRIQSGRK